MITITAAKEEARRIIEMASKGKPVEQRPPEIKLGFRDIAEKITRSAAQNKQTGNTVQTA